MTSQGSRFPKNIFSKQFYGGLRKMKKFIDFTKVCSLPDVQSMYMTVVIQREYKRY